MIAIYRSRPQPHRPLILAGLLLAAELLAIGVIFKHGIDFRCLAFWPQGACQLASRALAGVYCVIAALALFAGLRRSLVRDLLAESSGDSRSLALNLAGFALALVPVLFLRETADSRGAVLPAFACWGLGMTLMLAGILLYLAPPARWRQFLSAAGPALALTVAVGAAAPQVAMLIQPLWQLDLIADATFRAVAWLVEAMGHPVEADPVAKIIRSGDFAISVAPVCSGIEGVALVTLFVSLYLWLFRAETRFPRALILYPLGVLASAALNVVRIAVLLIIGINGHPELAVGGFHSHAGWIMFTLVALGIIAVARHTPALQRRSAAGPVLAGPPPLSRDEMAARILPFAVFMLTAVVVPAISTSPAIFYPLRVVLLAAAVALFWPIYRALPWRVAPLAVAAGAAIGLMWVLIPVAPAETAPYGALTGAPLALWYLFRGLGTVLLVPLVEELFFRGYVESRLRGGGPLITAPRWRVVLAAVVTAALFAALHDRWAEAFVAGLAFSWLARRGGRITDAVVAHMVANLIVFAVAAATGNLAII